MITKKDVAFFGVTTLVVLGLLSVALVVWEKELPKKAILPASALIVALIALLFLKDKSLRIVLSLAAAFLLLITVGVLLSSHREKTKEEKKVAAAAQQLREAQAALIPQRWEQKVILAQQHEGVLQELPEEGWYVIQHSGGKIFDNRSEYEKNAAWDIWGGGSPPREKAEGFLYPGLQSQQVVINPDGEGKVVVFPDGQRTTKFFAKKFVVLERNEYVPLINGERDYSSIDRTIGQWTFRVWKDPAN